MKIIAIEGQDGVGKSTLAAAMYSKLQGMCNWRINGIATPSYMTGAGHYMRRLLNHPEQDSLPWQAKAAYFAGDMLQLVQDCKNLDFFVVDRWKSSTCVYQAAHAYLKNPSVSYRDYMIMVSNIIECVPKADLTLFIDLPVEISQARLKGRHNNVTDTNMDLQNLVRKGYESLMRQHPNHVLDGQKTADRLVQDAMTIIKKEFDLDN